MLEVGHVRFYAITRIEHHFIVVHVVCHHLVDFVIWGACSNILSIVTATSSDVVRIFAA